MHPTQILTLAILSILAGIYIGGLGLRHILKLYLAMTWLHIQVSNRPDRKEVSYEFSNPFMWLCSFGPVIGLALILIGIKYLP